jgi:hypothetical protein
MTLYNQDVIECEGALYEDAETLVTYAKEHYKEFIVYSDVEILDVRYDGELIIEYRTDSYDENDNEIKVVEKETFEVTPRDMMTTVRITHLI